MNLDKTKQCVNISAYVDNRTERVFPSLKCCADSLSPRVCTYVRIRMITDPTHVKDPVVHVRVLWNTETRKDPACTLLTEGHVYFCTVNLNNRVVSSDLHTK